MSLYRPYISWGRGDIMIVTSRSHMHLWKGCVRVCQQVEDNIIHLIN